MTAVVLALASSMAWGVSDFFGGLQTRRRPLLTVMVVTQAAGFAAILVTAAVRGSSPPAGGGWIAWALLASLCGNVGLAAFYRGLATGAMGVVAPISAAAAVVPLAFGLAIGERPHAVQAAGVVLAIAGVVLAAREGRGVNAAGAGLAVVAALGFGGFFVGIERASRSDVLWGMLASRGASIGFLACATLVARPDLPRRARDLAGLAAVGLLDTTANLLFALASTVGLVSLVAVLGSLYPIVTVVLARLVLEERLRLHQRVGAVGALTGAAMIAAG